MEGVRMPHSFGTKESDDGVDASTNSSTKVGVFGQNESTASATGPGGSGVFGLTVAPGGAGVFGANTAPDGSLGRGVQGNGPEVGVAGFSTQGIAVLAQSNSGDGLVASTGSSQKMGVTGQNDSTATATGPGGSGVFGLTVAPGGAGVFGANNAPDGSLGRGVQGNGPEAGVAGFSTHGTGVLAQSNDGDGLLASTGSSQHVGVTGQNNSTAMATGPGGSGVFGLTVAPGGAGVFGANNAPDGSPGRGVQGNGPEAGVAGYSAQGIGVLAQSGGIGIKAQAPTAGHFDGDIEVTGDIKLLGADCAEDFDVSDPTAAEPGTVMVLNDAGGVRVSDQNYDSRVAGVISGAGYYEPALILDRQAQCESRRPLALMGKVFCKIDATDVPVAIGDLLTTSSTPGHAMKAVDPQRAFGAVIGKALQPFSGGRGFIPILVTLQ
jgi:hypothetical protein